MTDKVIYYASIFFREVNKLAEYIKAYIITLIIFFAVDLVWLGVIAKDMYRNKIGFIMKDSFNMTAAVAFYMVFIIGLIFFVINKAVIMGSWQYALFAGMFFGFITYLTYDMTNLATLKDWPLSITVIDIIWGSVLNLSVLLISYFILSYLNYFK